VKSDALATEDLANNIDTQKIEALFTSIREKLDNIFQMDTAQGTKQELLEAFHHSIKFPRK
jgi:hypothetical protein